MINRDIDVFDKNGIRYKSTAEGKIAGIPVYLIDNQWKIKSKYNVVEKLDTSIDDKMMEYIKICFIDFSDENRLRINRSSNILSINVSIPDDKTLTFNDKSIRGISDVLNWRLEQLEQIESILNKVKLLYNRLFYYIEFNEPQAGTSIDRNKSSIYLSISRYRSSLKQREL